MIAKSLSVLPFLLRAGEEIDPEAGEFNLFLFCFVVVALTALCLLIVIGIVVGLVAAAALAGVSFLGIMANAIISGLACKSPKVGVTVLTLQFGGLIGIVAGTASCIAARWFLKYDPLDLIALLICGTLGLVLGASVSWICFRLVTTIFGQIKKYCDSRLRKPTKLPDELLPPVATDALASFPVADAPGGGGIDN